MMTCHLGSAAWVWTWYHSDHLGSATVIADKDGNAVRRLAYTAFGEEIVNTGSGDAPPYTYTGKERDASGLLYYGARYYDPALARFITPDTVFDAGTQGLNRYSYALNNPIRYTDPSGHQAADQAFQRWIDSNPLERVGLTDPNPFTPLLPYLEGNDALPRSLFGTEQFYTQLVLNDVRGLDVAAMSLDDLDQFYVTTAISHAKTIGLALPAAHLGTMRGLSRPTKITSSQRTVQGARGISSGREFNQTHAGGKIRRLMLEKIRITNKGIQVVENHLARFGLDKPNQVMLQRLRKIMTGDVESTIQDVRFYAHELREYVRYRRLGFETGQPLDENAAYNLWNNAHTATLEDYRLGAMPEELYHPDALKYME